MDLVQLLFDYCTSVAGYAKSGWIIRTSGQTMPWTSKRWSQSILKEINPDSLEWLMLKLKFQYFGHLMQRANLLEETLILGKIEGRRSGVQERKRWLDSIIDSMEVSLSKLMKIVEDREESDMTQRPSKNSSNWKYDQTGESVQTMLNQLEWCWVSTHYAVSQ